MREPWREALYPDCGQVSDVAVACLRPSRRNSQRGHYSPYSSCGYPYSSLSPDSSRVPSAILPQRGRDLGTRFRLALAWLGTTAEPAAARGRGVITTLQSQRTGSSEYDRRSSAATNRASEKSPRTFRPGRPAATVPPGLRRGGEDRLQQGRSPHATVVITGKVDRLIQGDWLIQRQSREREEGECGDREMDQLFPVADPHRLRQGQALGAESLLGELEAVELAYRPCGTRSRTAPVARRSRGRSQDVRDPALVLRLEPLDAERADTVEHPDGKRLALDPRRGTIIDDRLARPRRR